MVRRKKRLKRGGLWTPYGHTRFGMELKLEIEFLFGNWRKWEIPIRIKKLEHGNFRDEIIRRKNYYGTIFPCVSIDLEKKL